MTKSNTTDITTKRNEVIELDENTKLLKIVTTFSDKVDNDNFEKLHNDKNKPKFHGGHIHIIKANKYE